MRFVRSRPARAGAAPARAAAYALAALAAACPVAAVAQTSADRSDRGDPAVHVRPEADSARRARRRDFDAEATVACAQERGEAMGECRARAARAGGGDAAVVVAFPNGFARTLHFVRGAFVSADATMSGVGTDTDARVEDGLHLVRVDDQRYEIPASLVLGTSPGRD